MPFKHKQQKNCVCSQHKAILRKGKAIVSRIMSPQWSMPEIKTKNAEKKTKKTLDTDGCPGEFYQNILKKIMPILQRLFKNRGINYTSKLILWNQNSLSTKTNKDIRHYRSIVPIDIKQLKILQIRYNST